MFGQSPTFVKLIRIGQKKNYRPGTWTLGSSCKQPNDHEVYKEKEKTK